MIDEFTELSDIYRDNDNKDELVDALNTLPPDERNLIVMYVCCNHNYSELARELNCSPQSIRKYLMKIKEKIKSRI